MVFPHGFWWFSNGIVNNFIVSFPLPLVYAQDVGRKPDRDARKTAESGFLGSRSAPVANAIKVKEIVSYVTSCFPLRGAPPMGRQERSAA